MGYINKEQADKLANIYTMTFELRERMVRGQVYLPPGFPVETVRESIRLEYERAMITLSLSVACGQRTRTDTVYFDIPATWWDHLKMQVCEYMHRKAAAGAMPAVFESWANRCLPVRFIARGKEVVVAENFCPHLAAARKEDHIEFLQLTPATPHTNERTEQ